VTAEPSPERAVRDFRPGDEPAILEVIEATLAADPLPGITVQDLAHGVERMPGQPGRTVVAAEDGRIVGFCFTSIDALFVHPAFRRRGHGRRIVEALVARLRDLGEPELKLYGAELESSRAFRDALGFRYATSLWRFELAPSVAVPRPVFPPGIVARTYRDDDLARYVAVAQASFADHPSPLTFSAPIVAHVHGLPDFDPHGILLLFAADDPDAAIGWAKADHELAETTGERRGSVAFIGVVPAWRGRGLGRELLRWSISHVRDAGAATIELNVEAANDGAKALYLATGFTPEVEWRQYVVPTGA
jgi:mycothiol synthase